MAANPEAGPVGADAGLLVTGTLGYVHSLLDPYEFGIHVVARYHTSSDDYHGTQYAPRGFQVGGLLSASFDGAPLF
jgi:hypothetical protein